MVIVQTRSEYDRVRKVKKLLLSAGNTIGNVHFYKRSDGKLKKMSYRLNVRKPSYSKPPTGKSRVDREDLELLTVYDTNCLRYNSKGRLCGRGSYKTISLDGVCRVSVNGEKYKIV